MREKKIPDWYLTATQIGEMLGITSVHVGHIAKSLGIFGDLRRIAVDGEGRRHYDPLVVPQIKKRLIQNKRRLAPKKEKKKCQS